MSEVAFTMMDLEAHAHRDLAYTFLDTYLESSGDYAGVAQLPFYCVYRALVRAKVNLIRTAQPDTPPAERQQAHDEYRHYVGIAAARANSKRGAIIITHGLSGSGKTTLTRPLAAALGAVRIRSDVERKRLHGLAALARQLDVPFAIVNVAATLDAVRARRRRIRSDSRGARSADRELRCAHDGRNALRVHDRSATRGGRACLARPVHKTLPATHPQRGPGVTMSSATGSGRRDPGRAQRPV